MNGYSPLNSITLNFLTCRTCFMLTFELFIPFDTFLLQYRLRNAFYMLKKFVLCLNEVI